MDLRLVETGDGGDVLRVGNDLGVLYSFQNMPYMALWGGNVKASTGPRIPSEQAFDFWGNTLLHENEPAAQFNSQTERTLGQVALNSSGRQLIQNAVNADLEFMRAFAVVVVEVQIIATDVVRIGIELTEPGNLQSKTFVYLWDNIKGMRPDPAYVPPVPANEEALQYQLQFLL